jgi:predicted DsbA family dithiol-disulfide isomerase
MSAEYPPEIRSQLYHRLNEMGKVYGVHFNRSDGYLANSRRALILSECAKKTSSFATMHLKIFKAYFEEGRDIGDREVLIELAESSGLSREEAEQAWQDASLKQQLQEIATTAHREGATGGVPTFIINERHKIVGVQPYSVFQETLQKIVAEKNR